MVHSNRPSITPARCYRIRFHRQIRQFTEHLRGVALPFVARFRGRSVNKYAQYSHAPRAIPSFSAGLSAGFLRSFVHSVPGSRRSLGFWAATCWALGYRWASAKQRQQQPPQHRHRQRPAIHQPCRNVCACECECVCVPEHSNRATKIGRLFGVTHEIMRPGSFRLCHNVLSISLPLVMIHGHRAHAHAHSKLFGVSGLDTHTHTNTWCEPQETETTDDSDLAPYATYSCTWARLYRQWVRARIDV